MTHAVLSAAVALFALSISGAAVAQEIARIDLDRGAPPLEPSPQPALSLSTLEMPTSDPGRYDEAPPEKPKRYTQRHLGFEIGARNQIVLFEGFDPYSRSDLLPHFAVAATWVPVRAGAVSLGVVGEYDIGGQSATARGDATALTVHRFSAGLQARFALASRLYTFVKAAPAALHLRASIDDAALDRPLVARTWTWGLDTTGGAALLLGAAGDRAWPAARFWLVGEIGYAFAGEAEMRFSPEADPEDPRRFGEVELPGLRAAGVVNRFAFAVTF
jgi:hypothetical protein